VTRRACASIVGVITLAASVALTGTMQLQASDAEKRDVGGSLSDAISYFPETSPFVKVLNFLGPWSGVIDGVAAMIYRRAIYILHHTLPKESAQQQPAPPESPIIGGAGFNGARDRFAEDEILAPNPAGFVG
jgi:hypothetical protein